MGPWLLRFARIIGFVLIITVWSWLNRNQLEPSTSIIITIAFLISVGLWLQSTLFILWMIVLVMPAWLFLLKVFEERELEIRFGAFYLEYKAKTPMLWPRRPAQAHSSTRGENESGDD
jgi:hypothetical protein